MESLVFFLLDMQVLIQTERNIKKVLEKLKNVKNRRARFRTVIAYKEKNIERIFVVQ